MLRSRRGWTGDGFIHINTSGARRARTLCGQEANRAHRRTRGEPCPRCHRLRKHDTRNGWLATVAFAFILASAARAQHLHPISATALLVVGLLLALVWDARVRGGAR